MIYTKSKYIPKTIPKGTTIEQWEVYAQNMVIHEKRVSREKPDPSQFGYEGSGLEESGGWTLEGGEQAYQKAYSQWQMMSSCDEPNKPGYYRANND